MADNNVPAELAKLAPGFIGSVGAMLWIKGTWPRRIALVVLGSATSYYASPYFVARMGMDHGLAGLLVGLFGMSVVDSVFNTWNEWLRVKLGLPPKEPRS